MAPRRPGAELPTGTVTFLFTDIEGSTRLLQDLGSKEWQRVLGAHNAILREAILGEGGVEVGTEGDAFFAVFASASGALRATVRAQRGLAAAEWPAAGPVRVRMGLHVGEGVVGGEDYIGIDVHRAARIAAAGHGGQVLLSEATVLLIGDGGLPDGVALRDLGEHRLKDLARPERILQLDIEGLPREFPAIRSLETPSNLPAQRTGFVGREHEVPRVRELLRGPGLLTLTGPGGSGKTRLALRVAEGLLGAYPEGVFFVDLAPVTDPDLVPAAIASAIHVRAEGRRSVIETLRGHLRHAEMLLVLDNFEQVRAAGPAVAGLLDASARLRLLVTSREPLRLAGEQEISVPPLELPDPSLGSDPERAGRSEAVALFVQRARSIDPAFRLTEANAGTVAEICRRLDGLPLAIELAASRTKLLAPAAILDRLGRRLELLTGGPVDVPQRQRTLREAIGWSFDLLGEEERTLFRRLAVFSGGWTLDAAEAVAGSPSEDLLEATSSLVDKSLVVASPGEDEVRFGMLATIREFGMERMGEAEEEESLRAAHAAHFVAMAEAAEPHLRLLDRRPYLERLETEHDNLRAALRWSVESLQTGTALRLAAALWRFWHLRGHLAEARRWCQEVLDLPAADSSDIERAKALTALGGVAYWQEDLEATGRAYEDALAIAREAGDPTLEAEALYNLSFVPAYRGDIPSAVETLEEARAMFERLGNDRGIADCTWLLAIVARLDGDTPTARARAEESLRLHRLAGDSFGATDALHVLGRIALAEGDVATAASCFFEALTLDEEVGNRTGMGIVLDNLAAEAGFRGEHLRAVRLGGASEAIKEAAGGHAPPPFIDLPDPRLAAREALGAAAVEAAWEEGRAMTLEQAVTLARGRA